MKMTVLDQPRLIHTKREYETVMAEVYRLLDLNPRRGSPEDERLQLLTLLVEDYETRTEPEIAPGTPQSLVEFMLDQKGLTKADLVKPLGGKSRVSEFFAGKRPLSTSQIKALRALLGIPADLLLGTEQTPRKTEVVSHVSTAQSRIRSGSPARKRKVAKSNRAFHGARKK